MTDDENARLELFRQLLTQAGMLFEDASAEAMIGGLESAELKARVQELLVVNERVGAILKAAAALL